MKIYVLADVDRLIVTAQLGKDIAAAILQCSPTDLSEFSEHDPQLHKKTHPEARVRTLVFDLDTATKTFRICHRFAYLFENSGRDDRVCVDKHQYVACRILGPGITDARDIVNAFVHHSYSGRFGDLSRAVCAFVLDDNYLALIDTI